MRRRPILLVLIASALLPLRVTAQSRSRDHDAYPGTPEMVAREFFTAIQNEAWDEAAALIAPVAREEFRVHMVQMLQAMAKRDSTPTAEKYPSTMPPAVRDWFEKQSKEAEARSGPWLAREFGIRSAPELDSLSDQELMARALRANDPRMMVQYQAEHARVALPPGVSADSAMRRMSTAFRTEYKVIGSVPENDSTVLVVYHSAIHQGHCCTSMPGETKVLTVRSTPAGWRIWPSQGLPQTTMMAFGIADYESATTLQMNAKEAVVRWPESGEPIGRAHLTGSGEQDAGPSALVIEIRADGGGWHKVEIPRAVFPQIFELLMPWGVEP